MGPSPPRRSAGRLPWRATALAAAAAPPGAVGAGAPPNGSRAAAAAREATAREALLLPQARDGESAGWSCGSRFTPPAYPGKDFTLHNGAALADTCFEGEGPFHVYAIGDWGGRGSPPVAAHEKVRRAWVPGADDQVQQRIAGLMRDRAQSSGEPDYLLNVGDNFYWAGVEASCLRPSDWQSQWLDVYEYIYTGQGIEGKQWLGVLGNHDYGGYRFDMGWTQNIAYTWMPDSRWMTPAQYWSSKVFYPGFSVDYYFVDSNVWDTNQVSLNVEHNICSLTHNPNGTSCAAQGGPVDVELCPKYFQDLWAAQMAWLESRLDASSADWQIVVTHFPPTWALEDWAKLSEYYGIDLIVTGHVHNQQFFGIGSENNPIKPTPYIISGGGGGITSESVPRADGQDDEYGFVDLTLTKEAITVEMISHRGILRNRAVFGPRPRGMPPRAAADPPGARPPEPDFEGPARRRERRRLLEAAQREWEARRQQWLDEGSRPPPAAAPAAGDDVAKRVAAPVALAALCALAVVGLSRCRGELAAAARSLPAAAARRAASVREAALRGADSLRQALGGKGTHDLLAHDPEPPRPAAWHGRAPAPAEVARASGWQAAGGAAAGQPRQERRSNARSWLDSGAEPAQEAERPPGAGARPGGAASGGAQGAPQAAGAWPREGATATGGGRGRSKIPEALRGPPA